MPIFTPHLATDDYINTQMRRILTVAPNADVSIFISCIRFSYNRNEPLTITHSIDFKANGQQLNLKGNDLMVLVDSVLQHLNITEQAVPNEYHLALSAPEAPPHRHEAPNQPFYDPTQPVDLDDDVPY